MRNNKINRLWFKNRLKAGELLARCTNKMTDDYAWDHSINYGTEKEFTPATTEKFDDWFIDKSYIWGDKDGVMNFCFASCEFYEFKLV